MAIMDTHEAFKLLQCAGLDEEKAEAIVRVVGVGQDALATKVGSVRRRRRSGSVSADDQSRPGIALAQTTKADLEALAQTADGSLAQTTKADLEALELRLRHDLTLRLGAMVFAAAGVQVAIVGFLLAQFLPN